MSRTLDKWPAPARQCCRVLPVTLGTAVMWSLGMFILVKRDIIGLPLEYATIIVTTCLLIGGAGGLATAVQWWVEFRLVFHVRNFMRRGGAICFRCGYRVDNLGPTSECCPECGYSIEESKVRTEAWVAKNVRGCSGFLLLPLLEPREGNDKEPPT